jgi:hypothetical protein
MKVFLTCSVQSFNDKRQVAVCELRRRAKEGPVVEVVLLRFAHADPYKDFKSRYAVDSSVQVFGLLRQLQSLIVDPGTRKPVKRSNGAEVLEATFAIEVHEHLQHRDFGCHPQNNRPLPGLIPALIAVRQCCSGLL